MGFRTVVVKSRAKLEFRLNSMVIRGETEKKILLNEINTLIIQSTAVSLTAALLNELVKCNVKVVFCDEKHNPSAELLPYYGAHNTSKRYRQQLGWKSETKGIVWQRIVQNKILQQANFLLSNGFRQQYEMLCKYACDVLPDDATNREGHAAKVYFNCLFADGVSRGSDNWCNTCLDYGYAIILSAFNREIVGSGYLTQLGIWHENEFNQFNLACDLMEPFRVAVDRLAFSLEENDKDFKRKMINLLNAKVVIEGKHTTLDVAIRVYTRSVLHALNNDSPQSIVFPEKIEFCDEL